jgi:crotonobetainyl-CoA:carnitine CoA-transferase CaiB-like acyl-CoA transferase
MMLADMGAEVLKIETPPAELAGGPTEQHNSEARRAAFNFVNRNKRSIAINLKHASGQRILHQLVARADVVVEGFRPGVMARLGGDYATLSQINPRLIYCSLSGFGQDGPYRDLPAHDINYLSLGGVLHLIGEPTRPPAIPLNIIADYAGASMHSVAGFCSPSWRDEQDVDSLSMCHILTPPCPCSQPLLWYAFLPEEPHMWAW